MQKKTLPKFKLFVKYRCGYVSEANTRIFMKMKYSTPKKAKTPWPTKDAMEQVYRMHLWGRNDAVFYSGEGSHDTKIVTPYLKSVITFLNSFDKKLTVCDLGCGDFEVGKELVKYAEKYHAVDIVASLIAHNTAIFKEDNLEFYCLDIAVDQLPLGDCALVRQVLQHLSNHEVHCILEKLKRFKYVIITEHIPKGKFTPNKDIISGQGTRLKLKSGLHVVDAPFHFKAKNVMILNTVILEGDAGIIVTTLYEMF